MPIEVKQQAIEITELHRILITEIVQDQESGEYVREIRVFEEPTTGPPVMGDETSRDDGRWLITLRLRSRERSNLHISVPSLEF